MNHKSKKRYCDISQKEYKANISLSNLTSVDVNIAMI